MEWYINLLLGIWLSLGFLEVYGFELKNVILLLIVVSKKYDDDFCFEMG